MHKSKHTSSLVRLLVWGIKSVLIWLNWVCSVWENEIYIQWWNAHINYTIWSVFKLFFIFIWWVFKKLFIYLERGERREKGRETSIGCLLHTPNWRTSLQPRHLPWLGIKSATFWSSGQCSQPTESHQPGLFNAF